MDSINPDQADTAVARVLLLLEEAGFEPVTDEKGAVLFHQDKRGILIEKEGRRLMVRDIRYLDDGDDGEGLFVYAADSPEKAVAAAEAWVATAAYYPIPDRRRAFEALMAGATPAVSDAV